MGLIRIGLCKKEKKEKISLKEKERKKKQARRFIMVVVNWIIHKSNETLIHLSTLTGSGVT